MDRIVISTLGLFSNVIELSFFFFRKTSLGKHCPLLEHQYSKTDRRTAALLQPNIVPSSLRVFDHRKDQPCHLKLGCASPPGIGPGIMRVRHFPIKPCGDINRRTALLTAQQFLNPFLCWVRGFAIRSLLVSTENHVHILGVWAMIKGQIADIVMCNHALCAIVRIDRMTGMVFEAHPTKPEKGVVG